ncbi:Ig-like domain-containing protein, partial [Emticicia sp. 17c]|uniref:Ig-like domain-containing protein n=1 Tax=Emticicia sp. 17c TaxID=3127704 RepID=UPI00301D6F1C
MSFVKTNTYCSPEFNRLKRSLFWHTYVSNKLAISLSVCLFLNLFFSSFAQNLTNSDKNQNFITASAGNTPNSLDPTLLAANQLTSTGYEGKIYADGEKLFNKNLLSAPEKPNYYTSTALVACDNFTSAGSIATANNQTIELYCQTSVDPAAFLTSSPSGGSGTAYYQWQSSPDNYTWTNISGATSSGYNPPAINTMTYYRRLARRIDCTDWVATNSILIAVNMMPSVSLAKTDPSCGTSNGTITATGSGGILGTGSITYQRWNNISGTSVSNLTSNANYPNNPSLTTTLARAEAAIDQADNFGGRIVGYIAPSITGTYYFWISSDDNGELWLSTDSNPANKSKIAYHTSWTSPRDWGAFATQKSVGINLVAGQIYYMEALYKEGGGGDNLAIGWSKPGDATNVPAEVIPIDAIRPYDNTGLNTPTYQFKIGSGSYQTGNSFSGLAAGTYTVTVTDVFGCTANSSITLAQNGSGTATASTNSPVCVGQTISLSASSSPAGATYKWTGPNGFSSTSQNVSRTNAALNMAGTYTLAVTFGSGCTATATTTTVVSVSSVPATPTATGGSVCGNGSATLSASGCSSGSYLWYTAATGGTYVGSGSPFNTPSISSTTSYYVECNIGACASSRALATAVVKNLPTASATGDTECEGDMIVLGASGGTSYSWSGPNGFSSSDQNPTIINTTPNMTGIYTVTVTNSDNCTATATASVTVNAIPSAPSGNNVSRCGTGTVTLTATGCSGTYKWYANGSTTANFASGASYTTPSLTASTDYYVSCTVNNCESTRTLIKAIISSAPPAPSTVGATRCGPGSVTLSASGCSGTYLWYMAATGGSSVGSGSSFSPSITGSTNYYVECNNACTSPRALAVATMKPLPSATATGDVECETSTVSLGAGGGTSYSWAGPLGFTSSLQNPNIVNSTTNMTGIYTVTVTNSDNCTATATASVTVNAIPSAPSGNNVSRCGTGTVTLTATGCSGTYKWYANGSTTANFASGASYTTPSLTASTDYYVSCTVNNCESTTRKVIRAIINPIPGAPTTNPISRCGTGPVTLVADNCNGTFNWYNSSGAYVGGNNYTTGNLSVGTYTYSVSCTENGCTSATRTSVTVTVLQPPTATASNTGTHCVGTIFKLIGGGNGESFSWSGPNGFSSSEQSPQVSGATAAMSGIYTLTVTASNGCTATATTNMVINANCTSVCTTPIAVIPANPTSCTATDGNIFITEYSAGPYYENSMDGITWYNSEKTYGGLGVGYYTIFIRDKTSKIVCRTISVTLTSVTSSYYTGETVTSATDCAATNGKIVLQGVNGTDDVSWISSTSRNFVKVSTLSPSNTISNLSPGLYYVVVTRGGNPLCYSERRVTVGNTGTPCPTGLCTIASPTNLFPGGDFGSGSSITGPSLAPGESQYSYAPINCDSPNDGNYTITNTTDCNGSASGGNIFTTWDILTQDHTPGDVNGYMMIVNASYNPDIVIERTITNLCPNTRYEYSLWIYNLCPPSNVDGCTIKPNLTFLVDGVGKYITGTLNSSGWQQVGFTFTTGNSTTSTFSIRNNAFGGQGNDWAIDDISIIQCLPSITQSANMTKCPGTTGQAISATVTDGSQQYKYYKWQQSTDGGSTWSDLTSGAIATFSSGVYTVSYTLPTITTTMNGNIYRIIVGTSTANLNSSSCFYNGAGTTLTVPNIAINISNTQTICANSSATISASASGGTSPYSYSWNNGLGSGSSKTVNPSATTTYTVTVTDANGCTATATTQVIVTSLPGAPTPINGSKCGPGTVTLGASGCAGTISWYASNTSTAILATGTGYTTPSLSAAQTTYYVNCTVNGCVSASRTAVTATINPIPTASATGDVECAGSTINLGASGGSTYSWAGPSGFTSNLQNPIIANATTNMAGTYTVTVTSAEGCTATATASVTVNPTPNPTISGTNVICVGQSTSLTANGGDSYVWSTGATDATITVNPATTTTYTVAAYAVNTNYTNLVRDALGFNASNFTYINSSSSFAGPQNLFDGVDNVNADTFHATRITNGQTWGIGYTLGGDYLINSLSIDGRNDCCTDRVKGGVMQIWKAGVMVYQSNILNGTGSGVISVSPTPNVIGDEIRYVFLNGVNTISNETTLNFAEWIIGGAKVCSASKQVTVTVNQLPTPTATSNSPVCSGKTLTLTASGGTSYSWAGPNGFASTGQSASISNVTNAAQGTYTLTVTNANGCTATATTSVIINDIPNISIGSNSPVCSGQTLTFTASGGASYSWAGPNGFASTSQNPNIPNVSSQNSGTYTVTVTNAAGCTATATIAINQPANLTANVVGVNVKCNAGNDGSATVTASGGTGPYTYQWSPSGGTSATASSLTAGTYTVTVKDANNCSVTATVTITQPAVLTASVTGVNVKCNVGNDGSATVTASGGTGPYTYQWSPSGGTSATASSLTAGTYTVTVKDANNCSVTATVTITQPTALTRTITGINVKCNGGNDGSATVTASGGTGPYTYQWSPSGGTSATASSLTAGTYTVTVKDANNCSVTATVTITQPTVLTASVTGVNVKCNSGNDG